ncbi:MAG: two-component regulator propeller domain-containing protein, partial [Flavobacteriales bacterium]
MKINIIKAILIILISGGFLSCNGQMKADKKSADVKNVTLGKLVSKLDNQIWSIFQDRKGNFWFGSNGKGLYHFDGNKLNLFTTSDNLVSNTIRGIQEDNKGNIYIETPKGVSTFDGINFTTLKIIKSPNNEWKLEQNDLWFNCNGNANHVYRFDGENLYELQLPRKNIEKKLGIDEKELSYSPYTVFGIDKDRNGKLWLGTVLAGAFRFDGNSFLWIGEKELSRLPDGREPGVRSILEDNDGNMWLSNFYSKYNIKSDSSQSYEKIKAVELS